MIKKSVRLFFTLTVIFSASIVNTKVALADSPSFTYIGTEYIASGDFSASSGSLSADVGLDGFALNASVELGIFFLQASRFELESDDLLEGNVSGNIEDSISTVAAGLTFELPRSQLYGLIRARRDEIEANVAGFSEDADGTTLGAEAGARVNLTNRLEINAYAGIPSTDAGLSYGLGAQFFITNNIGLTFNINSIELEEDDVEAQFDTTSIGLRLSF